MAWLGKCLAVPLHPLPHASPTPHLTCPPHPITHLPTPPLTSPAHPRDLTESSGADTGIESLGGYQLHDLVQIDATTCGVIVKIDRDVAKVRGSSNTDRTTTTSMTKLSSSYPYPLTPHR